VPQQDPRRLPDDRPNSGPMPLIETIRALEGEEMPEDQDAVLEPSEIESERGVTDTEIYLGELEAGMAGDRTPDAGEIESLEGLADQDLRAGETDIPYVASDEGLTYVPPSDPPVVPSDDPQGVDVAAGFGTQPEDDFGEGSELLSEGSDLTERIREAFRADASTSTLADQVVIGTRGSTVVLRGVVDTIDDGDSLAAVAARVAGVDEVRDETEVEGL
jgi:hypothetical protein